MTHVPLQFGTTGKRRRRLGSALATFSNGPLNDYTYRESKTRMPVLKASVPIQWARTDNLAARLTEQFFFGRREALVNLMPLRM